jgi:hypothetical protein
MKKIKFLFSALTILLISAAQAQTVDEIVKAHTEAIGGKEVLSRVKSLYIENSMDVMGNQSVSTEYLLEGKGYKSESEFNGMKIMNCFTDKGGWSVNPLAGAADAQALPEDAYKSGKDQIYVGGALVDYAAKGNKVELAGKEGNNYKLKVTSGSTETTYYIDMTTNYITKTLIKGEMMGQAVEIVTTFSDYKKTDFGIVLPYTKVIDFGGFALTYKRTKVEVNKELDPKIFEMPK